ncbi:MAG TPA: hypothetical protein P5163_00605 [Rubrivivax sp.]|nr:hypothetical protein [Rubrivivax sp.]
MESYGNEKWAALMRSEEEPIRIISRVLPRHFRGLNTQLVDGHLTFEETISDELRRGRLMTTSKDVTKLARIVESSGQRASTLVMANRGLGRADWCSLFSMMSGPRTPTKERVDVKTATRLAACNRWERDASDPVINFEGQTATLFALDLTAGGVVGFAQVSFSLMWSEPEGKYETDLYIKVDRIHVAPQHRGKGYGIDLAIAMGDLCADVLVACKRTTLPRHGMGTMVSGDHLTPRGRPAVEQVFGRLYAVRAELMGGAKARPPHVRRIRYDEPHLFAVPISFEALRSSCVATATESDS